MKAKGAEGLVWTEENLDKYLTKPKAFVPHNKMSFNGLKKAQDRADVIAYLKSVAK
jgi:cytochrome c